MFHQLVFFSEDQEEQSEVLVTNPFVDMEDPSPKCRIKDFTIKLGGAAAAYRDK